MAERVLTLPLSGLEIRRAITDILGKTLERDCYLNPDTAYDRFECEISLNIKCHDIGRVASVAITEKFSGAAPGAEDAALEEVDKQFEIHSTSPNETRVETGQEVPVLTRDADGKDVIKGVRYSRNQLQKAGTK